MKKLRYDTKRLIREFNGLGRGAFRVGRKDEKDVPSKRRKYRVDFKH